MISKRFKTIFLVALILIYAHGVEEVITGFQSIDFFMLFGADLFGTTPELFYWVSHIIWWLSVPVIFLVFQRTSIIFPLLAIFGLVFFVEIHHLIKALLAQSYYPGMFTVFLYPIFGIYFYRELMREWKHEA